MKALLLILAMAVLGMSATGAWLYVTLPGAPSPLPVIAFELPSTPAEASAEEVHTFCGKCHAYPPADTFPRSAWRKEVKQAYDFFRDSKLQMPAPSMESVALYYERQAPTTLPLVEQTKLATPPSLRWNRTGYAAPENESCPGVTNVNLAKLFDKHRQDVLVCDIHLGQVLAFQAYTDPPTWKVLASSLAAPCHAEAVDLDRDSIPDVLVANLGSFSGTDLRQGSVVWLRGMGDGKFTPIPLLERQGRVADAQVGDFRGTGQLDVVVAVFGWRNTGEILFLENRTRDWSRPVFVPQVLDDRHGAVAVCVADLDGDGKLDVIALLSQEHEAIVAFMNQGGGRFVKRTLYEAPHPAYGSSGIQVVDLNGDGKLDVLYSNGDAEDGPPVLKPYHGVQWLENKGDGKFRHHHLTSMYGVSRAVAADFRQQGKLDIVAVSSLSKQRFPQRESLDLDAVVFLENIGDGKFLRHSLETRTCDHYSCCVGDVYGDGKATLVIGNCSTRKDPIVDTITIWRPVPP